MTRESGLPERVEILEVGPRDGLQNEKTPVSTADKVALIERLAAAGLKRIEATSFVSPRRVPQMADAAEVMARVPRGNGLSYTGLVLSPTGAERAVAAECDELGYAIVASETFAQRNQGRSVAETVADWRRVCAIARAAGKRATVTVVTAFGCPFEGPVAPERVAGLVAEVMAEDPDEVCLADTIGVAVPSQVRDLFGRIAETMKGARLRAHFHNTRNTGYANAYAALLSGVSVLDASAGGVGGCPFAPRATGNIATEDLVYLLDGLGVASGVDGAAVGALEEWLEARLGHPVPGQLGKAGFSAVAA